MASHQMSARRALRRSARAVVDTGCASSVRDTHRRRRVSFAAPPALSVGRLVVGRLLGRRWPLVCATATADSVAVAATAAAAVAAAAAAPV